MASASQLMINYVPEGRHHGHVTHFLCKG